jgi:glycosyltransferase involved in cell wall biosynthesis
MVAPTSFFADYGAHVRPLEEIRALQALGHQITVCTYHSGNDVPGIDIRRSLDVPWRRGVEVGSSRHKLYFDGMLAFTVLRAGLQVRPDVIHAHLHEGALIGYLLRQILRAPLIFDYQGSLSGEMVDHRFLRRDGPFYEPVRWGESRINYLADAVITSSERAAEQLRSAFNYPADRVFPVTDGVNTSAWRAPQTDEERRQCLERRAYLGIPPEAPVVVYLGLLASYQGTDLLIEAARQVLQQMPETRFVIMGFPGVDRYKAMADELGVSSRVVFPGRIPYDEAPQWLCIGDVAVAPKLSDTEGAGKIGNYMALGLPTVTFDTAISREFLGQLGIYAQPGNPESLAAKLLEALHLRDKATLGAQLREKAERERSWNTAAHRILDVYGLAQEWRRTARFRGQPRSHRAVVGDR